MAQDFSTFGMAALLPGMQYMLDQMQAQLDSFRAQLAAAQGPKQVGRPPKMAIDTNVQVNLRKSFWSNMSPEQRSAEMKRRQAVIRGEVPPKNGRAVRVVKVEPPPSMFRKSDPRHPQYDEWRARVGAGRKAAWNKLSKAKQRAQLAKMQRARQEKSLARVEAAA